jgi:hypothetical protein
MNVAICTLFEGDYHHGVAALANSLCTGGFRGTIYAGYRGDLPTWALSAILSENGHRVMNLAIDVEISFVPLETQAHFTNYKPDFMMELWDGPARDAAAMIYVDPDIVFNVPWRFFNDAIQCGVLLCEDVNSPIHRNHPSRAGWRRYFPDLKKSDNDLFVNGGFVGVPAEARVFIERWRILMARIAGILGSTAANALDGNCLPVEVFADCFSQPDQDALNAAMDDSPDITFSILGRQAMGFYPGRCLVPHSQGYRKDKPWRRHYLFEFLGGKPPSAADKAFWRYAGLGPLKTFSSTRISFIRTKIAVASFLSRFYCRG